MEAFAERWRLEIKMDAFAERQRSAIEAHLPYAVFLNLAIQRRLADAEHLRSLFYISSGMAYCELDNRLFRIHHGNRPGRMLDGRKSIIGLASA